MIDKKKTMMLFTCLLVLMMLAGEAIMMLFFPSCTSKGYLVIPGYFWLLYMVAIYLVPSDMDGKAIAKYMMVFKGAKMIVSLFVLLALSMLLRPQALSVISHYVVYYTLLMIPESMYLMSMKKRVLNK